MATVYIITHDTNEQYSGESFVDVYGNETKAIEFCKAQLKENYDDCTEDEVELQVNFDAEGKRIQVGIFSKIYEEMQEWYFVQQKKVQ